MESQKLAASVCGGVLSQYLPFDPTRTHSREDNSTVDEKQRAISLTRATDCSLERTEEELTQLFGYRSTFTSTCAAELPSFLCRYFFRPCSGSRSTVLWDSVTSEECLSLHQRKCRVELPIIEQVLKSFGACLTIPDCISMITAQRDPTHPTEMVIYYMSNSVRFWFYCLSVCAYILEICVKLKWRSGALKQLWWF